MKKTIENSSFRPEQKIEIQGIDFLLSENAVDTYLNTLSGYCLPKHYKWIDKDGEPVENPTEEQQKELTYIFDANKTFTPSNLVECFSFTSNYPEDAQIEFRNLLNLLEFKRRMVELHHNEAEAGRTVLIETLQKEMQDKENLNLQVNAESDKK